jgi:D-alanine-D-alanine ligase
VKKVLIITGPAGDAQGWGDLSVTESLRDALCTGNKKAKIAFVKTMADFQRAIANNVFDIIWSALYHISDNADTIGLSVADDAWLADHFDVLGLPYIGPNAKTMKQLIDKTETHAILQGAGIPVPEHYRVDPGGELPQVAFPAFVKPSCESRSVGINDHSVVHTSQQLASQVAFVHSEYRQPALIEAYLPGQEYTVLMLGNKERQLFLPGIVTLDGAYGKYPILSADLRGVGMTKIKRPDTLADEAVALCQRSVATLDCLDHVRVDMRLDSSSRLRIIEVNGIPGLKPRKSWSPQLYTLYHGSEKGPDHDYRNMVNLIVDAALQRYGLSA